MERAHMFIGSPDPHAPAHSAVSIDESRMYGYSGDMKLAHKRIVDEALRLPVAARAALAGHLLESLEEDFDEGIESAWRLEIARRIDDLDRGKVKSLSWSAARRQIVGPSGGRAKR